MFITLSELQEAGYYGSTAVIPAILELVGFLIVRIRTPAPIPLTPSATHKAVAAPVAGGRRSRNSQINEAVGEPHAEPSVFKYGWSGVALTTALLLHGYHEWEWGSVYGVAGSITIVVAVAMIWLYGSWCSHDSKSRSFVLTKDDYRWQLHLTTHRSPARVLLEVALFTCAASSWAMAGGIIFGEHG